MGDTGHGGVLGELMSRLDCGSEAERSSGLDAQPSGLRRGIRKWILNRGDQGIILSRCVEGHKGPGRFPPPSSLAR